MLEAGFSGELHTHYSVRLPIGGGWPLDPNWKEVGRFNRASLEQGLEGFVSYLCTQVLGWQDAEVAVFLAKVRQAINNTSCQAHYPLLVLLQNEVSGSQS